MYKKISLYLMLSTTLVISQTLCLEEAETSIITTPDNDLNQETISYDHLDFLGDNLPEISNEPVEVPHWIKTVLIGAIVRLADLSEFWQKSWKRIKFFLVKK